MTRRRFIETIRVSAYLLAMCLIILVAAKLRRASSTARLFFASTG
jgi:hypothetical protein